MFDEQQAHQIFIYFLTVQKVSIFDSFLKLAFYFLRLFNLVHEPLQNVLSIEYSLNSHLRYVAKISELSNSLICGKKCNYEIF